MSKVLAVPYYAQSDHEPWCYTYSNAQCSPTSNAMLGFYLNKSQLTRSQLNGFTEPESYYKHLMEISGFSAADRGNHDAHTEILSKYFHIESVWRKDLTPQDFRDSIDKGFPVVCVLNYKVSDHIAIALGYRETGLLINAPYGIRAGTSNEYKRINPGYGELSGKEDSYSWASLDRILFKDGGLGRIVTRIQKNYQY